MQNEDVREEGAEHCGAEPEGRECREAWNEEGDRADELDETGGDAEPLAATDLLENLHHHRHAGELGECRGEEGDGKQTLETPGQN